MTLPKNQFPMTPLGDLVEELRYGTSTKSAEIGKPALRIPNVLTGSLDLKEIKCVPVDDAELNRLRLVDGDVLFVRTNGNPEYVGRASVFTKKSVEHAGFKSDEFVYASYLIRARLKLQLLDPGFLRHFVASPMGRQALRDRCRTSAGQYNINTGSLESIPIPLPPLPEQKRIADILGKADSICRKRQEAVDQAEHILRSSYLELFGDPVANPNGWPMENLGSIADMVTGFAFKSSEYTPEGVRLCRGANVLPDVIDWSDVRFWRMDDSTIDPRMKLAAGDVVLAMDRPWISTGIKVAQITDVDLPAYLVQRVTRLRGEGFVSNAFLYYTIRHPAFTAHCGGLKTETTIPHISSADIKSFPVPVAPKHIHERFELLAKNTQTAIQKLRLAADEAVSLFNSLVQRAFKGDL